MAAMKRLFGRDKAKITKQVPGARDLAASPTGGILTAPPEDISFAAQQYGTQERQPLRASTDEHWDIVSTHDGNSPVLSSYGPRSVSPYGIPPTVPPKHTIPKDRDRDLQILRKKPPIVPNPTAAVGILKALDPHPELHPLQRENSDEYSNEQSSREEKREKKSFWERTKEREREKEKERERKQEKERREEEGQAELTRMIGYLTATASEDWSLVLEVCERASQSEAHAKEAMKALRREFKYAEPAAQLSAARLWAIMLRNCSEVFITQCSSRKFLETLEDVIHNTRTSPVVRERLLEVLAGAAYMSPPVQPTETHILGRHDSHGFRTLWRKVKPPEKPEEGVPFDTEDAMFNPPTRLKTEPVVISEPMAMHSPQMQNGQQRPPATKHKSSSRNRVIPPEEDIRKLFQECNVGKGNAALLSDALAFAKPEDLQHKDVIKEFYAKCRSSQELIFAAIPWASAGAERSRRAEGRDGIQQKRSHSGGDPTQPRLIPGQEEHHELTVEERLLAELLAANEELTAALRQYDDLERVGIERDTEERSKKETRIDRNRLYYDMEGVHLEPPQPIYGGSSHTPSPSSSPSASPAPSVTITHSSGHPRSLMPAQSTQPSSMNYGSQPSLPSLAPPPPAPHGPRPVATRSRTPSPDRSSLAHSQQYREYNHDMLQQAVGRITLNDSESPIDSDDDHGRDGRIQQPSAKVLGKRRAVAVEDPDSTFDPHDIFYEHTNDSRRSDDLASDESEESQHQPLWHQTVHYVYDAAAERMQERLREARLSTSLANANAVVKEVH